MTNMHIITMQLKFSDHNSIIVIWIENFVHWNIILNPNITFLNKWLKDPRPRDI